MDAANSQAIDGALAEVKIIGVPGAGMTVDNVARFREFAQRGVNLMSVNVQELHPPKRQPVPGRVARLTATPCCARMVQWG